MRFVLLTLCAVAALIFSTPTLAQDDIYLPPDDELVIDDGPDDFAEDDGPYVFPGNGFPASELCLQFLEARGIDPEGGAFFSRLPSVCYWRYAGYPCEPEQNPPEGWLRPGAYCDKIKSPSTISYDFDAPSPKRYVPK
jgi:hypothetical protein